jgi:hypothetical protein
VHDGQALAAGTGDGGGSGVGLQRPVIGKPTSIVADLGKRAGVADGRSEMRVIRRRHLLRAAVAVTGALSVWLMMMPDAEASWSSTYTLSQSGWWGKDSPSVAVDRQGDSLLVWTACDTSALYCRDQVQARIKPRTGPMGPVKTLSPWLPGAAWPMAASDDDGDSAVVWQVTTAR